jgi:glutamyl-tRNA reductase
MLKPAALRPHLYVHTDAAAVRHLIRVAAGLDSLALGESQIAGQVRAAWRNAGAHTPLGAELDLVLRHALEAARQIRASGAFARHPSVASIGVTAAAHALGGLAGRTAAVLGAGVTGKAAARELVAAGARHVTLLNRSPGHAAAVAEALALGDRLSPAPLDCLPAVLQQADAAICATAAPFSVVPAAMVEASLEAREGRPLILIDIALPRDVDPAVRNLPGVRLIDLDDLEAHCALDAADRRRELDRAEALAGEAAAACVAALREREAVPEIVALRRHAEAIRTSALRQASGRLERLGPTERATVEQLTHSIVQRLLHGPTVALRRTAGTAGTPAAAARERAALLGALRQTGTRQRQARHDPRQAGASAERPRHPRTQPGRPLAPFEGAAAPPVTGT